MPALKLTSDGERGPEVHAAFASREPHAQRPPGAEEGVDGEQALEYGLPSQRVVRSTVDYESAGGAGRFFENWRASLKWQRLKPYEEFAEMIDRHWDGIAAYCKPENKVSLGFVEGLNNKIRVIQRRAYGFRDEQYLRLKVLTCMLPEL